MAILSAQTMVTRMVDISDSDPISNSSTADILNGFQYADILFFMTHGNMSEITNSFSEPVKFKPHVYPPVENSVFLAFLKEYYPTSGPLYYGIPSRVDNTAPVLQVYYACGVVNPYTSPSASVPQYYVVDVMTSPSLLMNTLSHRLDPRTQTSLNVVGFDRTIQVASCIPWSMYESILQNIEEGNWGAATTLVAQSYGMFTNGHFKVFMDAIGDGAGIAESVELANSEYMVSDEHMQMIQNDDGTFFLESSPVGSVVAEAPYIPETAKSAGVYFVPLSVAEENRRKLEGKSLRVQILPGYKGNEIAW